MCPSSVTPTLGTFTLVRNAAGPGPSCLSASVCAKNGNLGYACAQMKQSTQEKETWKILYAYSAPVLFYWG